MWILSNKDAILISRSTSHTAYVLITQNFSKEKYCIIGLSQGNNEGMILRREKRFRSESWKIALVAV